MADSVASPSPSYVTRAEWEALKNVLLQLLQSVAGLEEWKASLAAAPAKSTTSIAAAFAQCSTEGAAGEQSTALLLSAAHAAMAEEVAVMKERVRVATEREKVAREEYFAVLAEAQRVEQSMGPNATAPGARMA